jgi:Predicted membrane protein
MGNFCSNCGHELQNGEKFCSTCGAQILPLQVDSSITQSPPSDVKNKKAIASLILGIVAVIFYVPLLFGIGFVDAIGLALAIVGLVLGVKAHKSYNGKGLALAGIIISTVLIGIQIISSIFGFLTGFISAFMAHM